MKASFFLCFPAPADPAILPLVLVALIGFAAHKEFAPLVSASHVLDVLLRIVAEYDLPFKRLAGGGTGGTHSPPALQLHVHLLGLWKVAWSMTARSLPSCIGSRLTFLCD